MDRSISDVLATTLRRLLCYGARMTVMHMNGGSLDTVGVGLPATDSLTRPKESDSESIRAARRTLRDFGERILSESQSPEDLIGLLDCMLTELDFFRAWLQLVASPEAAEMLPDQLVIDHTFRFALGEEKVLGGATKQLDGLRPAMLALTRHFHSTVVNDLVGLNPQQIDERAREFQALLYLPSESFARLQIHRWMGCLAGIALDIAIDHEQPLPQWQSDTLTELRKQGILAELALGRIAGHDALSSMLPPGSTVDAATFDRETEEWERVVTMWTTLVEKTSGLPTPIELDLPDDGE